MVVKPAQLALDHIFDTAKEYFIPKALPALLEASHTLTTESWESCLHTSTSPIPQAMEVRDGIPDRGLGPIGKHDLPVELWRSVVPNFYHSGLADFNVEAAWQDGARQLKGMSHWVSPHVERLVRVLQGVGVYEVPCKSLPPTWYPFVVPKSVEKVNLSLICVRLKRQDGAPHLKAGLLRGP